MPGSTTSRPTTHSAAPTRGRKGAVSNEEVVRSKLAQANADVADAERQLSAVALDAALTDNHDKAEGAQAWLNKATAHRDRLNVALSVAEQAEAARIAKRGNKEDRS